MLSLWYFILGGLLSIIVVAGNGIVIYLIVTRQRLYTTANWFILSLAIADFFVGASYLLADYLCEAHSCDRRYIRHAIVSFLLAASATNLCVMTVDRYIAIVKPLEYITFMTTRRVVLLISTAWLAPFLPHFIIHSTPSLLNLRTYEDSWFSISSYLKFSHLSLCPSLPDTFSSSLEDTRVKRPY